MARLVFGGDDVSMRGPYGSAQLNASGRTGIVYADATTSTLADIVTYPGGAAIAGSVITVTADSQLPLFQGPADGSDTVWVSVDGGTRTPIYARVDDRIDALAARVAAIEPPSGTYAFGSVYVQPGADIAAVQAAINTAVAAGKDVVFPPGTFNIVYTADGQGLTVTGSTRIRGAHRNLTSLVFTPATPTFTYYGFDISPDIKVTIEDLSLVGPPNGERVVTDAAVTSGSPVVTSVSAAWTADDVGRLIDVGSTAIQTATILSLGPGANDVTTNQNSAATASAQSAVIQNQLTQAVAVNRAGTRNDLTETRLRRVNITGQWRNAIDNGGSGNSTLEMEDCYLESQRSTISTGGDDALTTFKQVLLDNVDFKGPSTASLAGQCHGLYIGPGVALRATNGRWRNTTANGFGVHYFGSGTNKPAFVIFDTCHFDAGSAGLIAPDTAITEVKNCRFSNLTGRAISLSTDSTKAMTGVGVNVTGCVFVNCVTGVGLRSASAITSADVNVVGCVAIDTTLVNCDGTNITWRVSDCTMRFLTKTSTMLQANQSTLSGGHVEVNDCQFFGWATASTSALRIRHGLVRIRGCYFEGNLGNGSGGVYVDGVGTSPEYIVEDCDFRNTGTPIFLVAGVANGILKGERNRFATVYPNTPSGTYQSLGVRRGLSPTAVASAASVTLPWTDYDTWHVTGTTGINTIIVGSATAMRSFNGMIRLVADAAWTLNNAATGTGQIRTKTAANRTVAVNEVVTLQFDPALLLWYEVA